MNQANKTWTRLLGEVLLTPDYVSKPRGLEVKEKLHAHYKVPMPAYVDLVSRKVNSSFMFAEAAWILEGSNSLSKVTPFMKNYANFSDDGVFMRGAYGPKVIEQLPYVVDSLVKDNDTRQAVINIWRERPGQSKDIPCTLSMQFFIRDGKLHAVVTMRSQDIVLGYTYDVFTFSMVAKAVKLLLRKQGVGTSLGNLYMNVGSLHLYSVHYTKAYSWIKETDTDVLIKSGVLAYANGNTYEELVENLWKGARGEV